MGSAKAEEEEGARLLRLLRKAATDGFIEWESDRVSAKVRDDARFQGMQPPSIKELAVTYIKAGGRITVRAETDEVWVGKRKFDYYFQISFPVVGLFVSVFMKLVIEDDDPDCPEAHIVGVHPSSY